MGSFAGGFFYLLQPDNSSIILNLAKEDDRKFLLHAEIPLYDYSATSPSTSWLSIPFLRSNGY
jgi:hypothetical protein